MSVEYAESMEILVCRGGFVLNYRKVCWGGGRGGVRLGHRRPRASGATEGIWRRHRLRSRDMRGLRVRKVVRGAAAGNTLPGNALYRACRGRLGCTYGPSDCFPGSFCLAWWRRRISCTVVKSYVVVSYSALYCLCDTLTPILRRLPLGTIS